MSYEQSQAYHEVLFAIYDEIERVNFCECPEAAKYVYRLFNYADGIKFAKRALLV